MGSQHSPSRIAGCHLAACAAGAGQRACAVAKLHLSAMFQMCSRCGSARLHHSLVSFCVWLLACCTEQADDHAQQETSEWCSLVRCP